MARERERNTAVRYASYGNVAYQPEYENSPSYAPRRQAEPHIRPRIRPRERVAVRTEVEVRRQSPVSLFAVAGFLAVVACAFMLLAAGIQLAVVADETFTLQKELTALQSEEKKLLAQYEQAYDLTAIEREMTTSGAMVRVGPLNTVYLDLAEADSVTYHEGASSGIAGVVESVEAAVRGLRPKS